MQTITKYLVLIILSALIITILIPINQYCNAEFQRPLIIMDSLDFGGWGDLKSFSINDNETHLIFKIEWFDKIPRSYQFRRYLRITIDKLSIDDWSLSPYDVIDHDIIIDVDQWGISTRFLVYVSGEDRVYKENKWIESEDSSIEIAVPLDILGVTKNQVLRIMMYGPRIDIEDMIIDKPIRVTIPSAKNIVIDGDPHDWVNYTKITDSIGDVAEYCYPDMNITDIYMAMNNDILYIRADYESPLNLAKYLGNTTDWDAFLEIHFGDGVSEKYALGLGPDVVFFQLDQDFMTWYTNYSIGYNTSWSGKCIEIALDISLIIKDLFIDNNTLYVHYLRYYASARDSALEPYDVIKYVVGTGGVVVSCIDRYEGLSQRGTYSVNIHNLTINMELRDVMSMDIYVYNGDLVTSKFLPLNSYIIDITVPQSISWPIQVMIHYDESLINALGMREENLALYIYNNALNTYVRCRDTYVDTESNVVYGYIDLDEYLMNKFLLITIMSPETALIPVYIPKTTTITKTITTTTKYLATTTRTETYTKTKTHSLTETKIITTPSTVEKPITKTMIITKVKETTMTTTIVLREPVYATSIATLVLGIVIGLLLYRFFKKR